MYIVEIKKRVNNCKDTLSSQSAICIKVGETWMREKSLAIVATYLRTRIIDFMLSYMSLYMHICICREPKHSVIILRALHVDTAA